EGRERAAAEAARLEAQRQAGQTEAALGKANEYLYLNRVLLAHSEYRDNHVGRAVALLDECPAELRAWEGRYLNRLWHPGRPTLPGHTDKVHAVAFSRDGQRLASAGADGTVRFWDLADGRELLRFKAHAGAVNGLAFSPDGQRLATAGGDRTAKVWEAETGA